VTSKLPAALTCAFASVICAIAGAADNLPAPWQQADIGAVAIAGSASESASVFTLKGSLDIWGLSDGCCFAWQPLRGDGQIMARVLSVEATQNHAKGGIAIRESLSADARHVTVVDTPTDGAQFLFREETGGKTTVQRTSLNKGTYPYWLKLVRAGDRLTGYESVDGSNWTEIGSTTLKLPETVYVGLVASSHLKDKLCAATFDKVSIGGR
jgi:hypothetical protein